MAPDAMLRAAEDPVDGLGRVLITGASGFIGSHLLEYLAERGASITCVRHTTRIAASVPAAKRAMKQDYFGGRGLTLG